MHSILPNLLPSLRRLSSVELLLRLLRLVLISSGILGLSKLVQLLLLAEASLGELVCHDLLTLRIGSLRLLRL